MCKTLVVEGVLKYYFVPAYVTSKNNKLGEHTILPKETGSVSDRFAFIYCDKWMPSKSDITAIGVNSVSCGVWDFKQTAEKTNEKL